MSSINDENFVGEFSSQPQPTNPISDVQTISRIPGEDLIAYEKERKCLFRLAFLVAILAIILLYSVFIFWIYSQSDGYHIHDNMWHIALILAIPPTTLLFLILKILARQQPTESSSHSPLMEFGNQLLGILREFLTKK